MSTIVQCTTTAATYALFLGKPIFMSNCLESRFLAIVCDLPLVLPFAIGDRGGTANGSMGAGGGGGGGNIKSIITLIACA